MIRFLTALVLLSGCAKHESQETTQDLSEVRRQRDEAVASFNGGAIPRCDFVTFAGLLEAFSDLNLGVYALERPEGMWHRDFQPCFPDDSKSETTRDGYVAILHRAVSKQDATVPARIAAYARPQGWVTGPGPVGVTSILDLAPIVEKLADSRESWLASAADLPPSSGHVLALILYLRGRIEGALSPAENAAVSLLVQDSPSDPMYLALKSRFDDGDQEEAIKALLAMPHEQNAMAWGSCPWEVFFAVTTAILEGR